MIQAVQQEFEFTGIYVNTASIGLPPRRAVAALADAIEIWRTGRAEAAGYDELVERARGRFAGLVGVAPDRVAIGNQVSTFTGLIAAALPDGALGRLYGPNKERGLYRTSDGGKTWEQVLFLDERTGVLDVQLNPADPDLILVAAWERTLP